MRRIVGLVAAVAAGIALVGLSVPVGASAATAKTSVVTGSFVDALTGLPLAGKKAYIGVNAEGGPYQTATLDAAGAFRFVVNLRSLATATARVGVIDGMTRPKGSTRN